MALWRPRPSGTRQYVTVLARVHVIFTNISCRLYTFPVKYPQRLRKLRRECHKAGHDLAIILPKPLNMQYDIYPLVHRNACLKRNDNVCYKKWLDIMYL